MCKIDWSNGKFLARLRAGDERAYQVLVHSLRPRMVAFAMTMVGNREDAKEIVQEAFMAALRTIHKYHVRNDLFFLIAVKNECRRRRQYDKAQKRPSRNAVVWLNAAQPSGDSEVQLADAISDEGEDGQAPPDIVCHQELLGFIRTHVNALPEPKRSIVFLHFFEGLTLAEIAELLELPAGTVRSHKHHALEKLRNEMDGASPLQP